MASEHYWDLLPLRFCIFLYRRLVQLQAHARLVQQRQAAMPGDRRLEVEHLIEAFPEQVKLGQPAIGHASLPDTFARHFAMNT